MGRYQIWNKIDNIFTPSGTKFTAQQWREKYPWVDIPGAKMIITTGIINGGTAMEFTATAEQYKRMGADIPDDWKEQIAKGSLTDSDILDAIEYFEDNPPGAGEPSIEERTAAALEFMAIMAMPDDYV